MPNRDKTGPNGKGPKTGRGLGVCKDKNLEKKISQETDEIAQDIITQDRRNFARRGRRPRIGSRNGSGDGRGDGTRSFNGSGRGLGQRNR